VAELYPAATLSTQASSIETLTAGIADVYILSVGANTNYFPISNFTSLPGLSFFPDTEPLLKKFSDTMREIYAKYPEAAAEWSEIKFLWNDCYTTAVLMPGSEAIRTPDDIQGVKVGCNGMRHDMINLIGGVGVFTIPPEMYQQLQTGVCDAVFVSWPAAGDWQLQEVVDYVYDFSFGDAAMPVGMNMDTWNSLSAEDQAMVMEAAAAGEQANRDRNVELIAQNRQVWADAGVEILQPTAEEKALWEEKFQMQWDVYINSNKDAGVQEIQGIFDYWKNAVESAR
jgi:TRAP-type C4-dicarboxylate transport system substrate-binding protein